MRTLSLFIVLGVVGCASSSAADDVGDAGDRGDDGHDLVAAPLDGMQTQGTFLLGQKLDGIGREPGYHVNALTRATTADGQPVTVVFDGSASLRSGDHRGADPFFNGMLLRGSEGAPLRRTVLRGGHDIALYKLEAQSLSGWTNLCDGAGDEAIPLAGKWRETGLHEPAADRISFACAGSVAFKCALWGYLPGNDSTSLGWRAHQACTRMALGDYCANGHTHTRQGTTIRIYDFVGVTSKPPHRFEGVQIWPPSADQMFFEAAWNDGAHPASCLSRRRWESLPLGTLCDSGELRDPRLDTSAQFCEDIEWPDPGNEPTGALLFNESYYTDLALHVWKNGDDLVSTIRGYFAESSAIQPFPDIAPYEHQRTDGIIYRSLQTVLKPGNFEELRLYARPGDLVVAGASRPPPGFTDMGFEGYVRKLHDTGVPFKLYRNASTGDYLSTTGSPEAPYELEWTIGYVLPPEAR